ncbi:MAG: DUF1036 domain-containing protein [Rhizomicrobium sp.]|jgi:uncharacterized membrane protein
MRLIAAALILFTTAPAFAGLAVCNKAALPAKVALGRFDGKVWRSEGWWTIQPQKCETLLSGPLDARFYYLYGTDGGSGTWNGGKNFCTSASGPFSIPGRGHCAARGYDRTGFFEIDTGDRADWTQSLGD